MFEAKWYIIISKQEKAHQAIDWATREAFFNRTMKQKQKL